MRGAADVDNMCYALMYPLARVTQRRIIVEVEVILVFLRKKKVFSSHHKIQTEPLMADGLS